MPKVHSVTYMYQAKIKQADHLYSSAALLALVSLSTSKLHIWVEKIYHKS